MPASGRPGPRPIVSPLSAPLADAVLLLIDRPAMVPLDAALPVMLLPAMAPPAVVPPPVLPAPVVASLVVAPPPVEAPPTMGVVLATLPLLMGLLAPPVVEVVVVGLL